MSVNVNKNYWNYLISVSFHINKMAAQTVQFSVRSHGILRKTCDSHTRQNRNIENSTYTVTERKVRITQLFKCDSRLQKSNLKSLPLSLPRIKKYIFKFWNIWMKQTHIYERKITLYSWVKNIQYPLLRYQPTGDFDRWGINLDLIHTIFFTESHNN